eukprot:CAMPEP_0178372956 /NCGR_PEP_ID=MMETSP0689_2-20121128/1619_1 /TAXON_ID=160604 /ORGANISM="Amphidinium massartii, Strain CS-259" /LENGTH=405 /DNA_ID=CAMNT_0019992893 /DNA_START=162 /DNA_END=1377 /DNA_ORIENTATION=-
MSYQKTVGKKDLGLKCNGFASNKKLLTERHHAHASRPEEEAAADDGTNASLKTFSETKAPTYCASEVDCDPGNAADTAQDHEQVLHEDRRLLVLSELSHILAYRDYKGEYPDEAAISMPRPRWSYNNGERSQYEGYLHPVPGAAEGLLGLLAEDRQRFVVAILSNMNNCLELSSSCPSSAEEGIAAFEWRVEGDLEKGEWLDLERYTTHRFVRAAGGQLHCESDPMYNTWGEGKLSEEPDGWIRWEGRWGSWYGYVTPDLWLEWYSSEHIWLCTWVPLAHTRPGPPTIASGHGHKVYVFDESFIWDASTSQKELHRVWSMLSENRIGCFGKENTVALDLSSNATSHWRNTIAVPPCCWTPHCYNEAVAPAIGRYLLCLANRRLTSGVSVEELLGELFSSLQPASR